MDHSKKKCCCVYFCKWYLLLSKYNSTTDSSAGIIAPPHNDDNENIRVNNRDRNGNDHHYHSDRRRKQVFVVEAPSGKLGIVIDTPDGGLPVVHAIKGTSVLVHQIQVGDYLMKVDDEDVQAMTAIKVSKLISKKSTNPVRRLTLVRILHDN